MAKINKQVLEDVLEGLDFISVDTDLAAEAIRQFGMVDDALEEPIMSAIKKDIPEWEFSFIDTVHLIHMKYWEFGELINA